MNKQEKLPINVGLGEVIEEHRRVLFCTTPLPDESGYGFLIRVAGELEYPTSAYINHLAGVSQTGLYGLESIQRLAYVLRLDPWLLSKHFYGLVQGRRGPVQRSFLGHAIGRSFINIHHSRICPECLRERPICCAIWDINLVTVCPRHRCQLINVCPSCQQPLSWCRASVNRCICGYDLRNAPTVSAPEGTVTLTALIHRSAQLPHSDEYSYVDAGYCNELMMLSFPKLLWIIRALGSVFHLPNTAVEEIQRDVKKVCSAPKLVETAHKVLMRWPEDFLDSLRAHDKCLAMNVTNRRRTIGIYGKLYARFRSELAKNDYTFIRRALRTIEGTDYDSII